MNYCDYHTHTILCNHAKGYPDEYVASALKAGLKEFGISDHMPYPKEYAHLDSGRMTLGQLPLYLEVIECSKKWADPRGLQVRCGMECDWFPVFEEWIKELKDKYNWDYLIGGIHDPLNQSYWEEYTVEEGWKEYWDNYCEMTQTGLFNILAHPDVVKRHGHVPAGDLTHYYLPTLEAAKAVNACIEINTSGWYKCDEQFPSAQFLQLAAKMGIPLTLSSDAHNPEHIASDFDRAAKLAYDCGFRKLVTFNQGEMGFIPIE